MEKYLIINADDFGMCAAHNIATKELLLSGAVTSATVMAPCPFARDAVEFAVKNPELSVGVHLTTTSEWGDYKWGPLSKGSSSLTDEKGNFYRSSSEFAESANPREVEAELISQIEALVSMGLEPSHVDNHMGSLYGITNGDFTLLTLAIKIAGKYGLPFRFPRRVTENSFKNGTLDIKIPESIVRGLLDSFAAFTDAEGVPTPDYLIPGDWQGEQDKSYESYKEYIFELYRTFDHGITETYIHPAVECEEIKAITPLWHRRVWEYRLFSDPKTQEFIKSLGIKLISYKELARIKTKK